MRHYEIVFLVHPDQSEQVPAMVDRYRGMITSGGGHVHREEDWGRRILAYMIDDVHKAHYVLLNIECELGTLEEIERHFRFNDSILRHLIIRRKEAIVEQSSIIRAKLEEEKAEAEARKRKSNDESKQASSPAPASSGGGDAAAGDSESADGKAEEKEAS